MVVYHFTWGWVGVTMVDSLLDKKLSKKFDTLAEKKANIQKEEDALCKQFLAEISSETIVYVLDTVQTSGHPKQRKVSEMLRNKYEEDELSFDDIMKLNELYKSNCRNMNNKGD